MFEILPEPEFSAWFESLSETDAEQVSGALEVIASAGTALPPARVSRLLLWYDGTAGAPATNAFGVMGIKRLALKKLGDRDAS